MNHNEPVKISPPKPIVLGKFNWKFDVIIPVLVFVFLGVMMFGMLSIAKANDEQKGQWSEWWDVERGGSVKRIYDQENKLVCWLFISGYRGGIDCQPSLELEHPLTQKL